MDARNPKNSLVKTVKTPVGVWFSKMKKKHKAIFKIPKVQPFVSACVEQGIDRETILSACEVKFNCNRGTARDAWGRAISSRKASKGARLKTARRSSSLSKSTICTFCEKTVELISGFGMKVVSDSRMREFVGATKLEWNDISSAPALDGLKISLNGKRYNGIFWGSREAIKILRMSASSI